MTWEEWTPTSQKQPNESGRFQVCLPDGAEVTALWSQERQQWKRIEEHEPAGRDSYSLPTGELCEVTRWRPT
jgi:hypothetical protein